MSTYTLVSYLCSDNTARFTIVGSPAASYATTYWNISYWNGSNLVPVPSGSGDIYTFHTNNKGTFFQWNSGLSSATKASSSILVSAIKADSYYLVQAASAFNIAGPTAIWMPLVLDTIATSIDANRANFSAIWVPTSGNASVLGTPIYPIPITATRISWNYTGPIGLSATLSGTPYVWGDNVWGAPSSTYLQLSADPTAGAAGYRINSVIYDGMSSYRTPQSFLFSTDNTSRFTASAGVLPLTASLNAYYGNNPSNEFPINYNLQWSITPNDGSFYVLSAGGPNTYQIPITGGFGPAANATSLQNLIFITTNYAGTYTISVSGSDGTIYTPPSYITYGDITVPGCTLQTTVVPICAVKPISYFSLLVNGISSDGVTPFNLNPERLMMYSNNWITDGVDALNSNRTNQYIFGTTDTVTNIDPLNLQVITKITNSPITCAYNIGVSAIDNFSLSAIANTNVTFFANEWLDDSAYYPSFGINNEPAGSGDLWRLNGTQPSNPWTITIRNSSITPSGAQGNIVFSFSDGNTSVQPINFNNFTYGVSIVSGSGPTNFTISSLMTDLIAPNQQANTTYNKVGETRTIHFLDYFPTANMDIYPMSAWDATTHAFSSVQLNSSNMGGTSAYGYCHTEIFTLSALSAVGVTYNWNISGYAGTYITNTNSNLLSAAVGSNAYTSSYPVELKLWNVSMPLSMPNYHVDDNSGLLVPYYNYTNTSINTSKTKNAILMQSFDAQLNGNVLVSATSFGVSAQALQLSSTFISLPTNLPVVLNTSNGTTTWVVSTPGWTHEYPSIPGVTNIYMNTDDNGSTPGIIRLYHPTQMQVIADSFVSLLPSQVQITDYCTGSDSVNMPVTPVTAWPLTPLVYVSNKYVLTGENVSFYNLVPQSPYITGFGWNNGFASTILHTNVPYVTSFTKAGRQDISLTTYYSAFNATYAETLMHNNIVTTLSEFPKYDPNNNRVFGATQLILPYSLAECEIPPNEWATSNNINKCFDRLQANLLYINNNALIYNKPPTEYHGWLGSLGESDGTIQYHWRVNQPNNAYKYTLSKNAISDYFTDVTDCEIQNIPGVMNDVMFVANTTSVKILSADFFAGEISSRSYRGIGENFVNLQAIGLDANFVTDPRIYLLDSARNLVVVFSYNHSDNIWKLLYSWGGLGGPNAQTKFNTPSDMLVDSSNFVWITDTNNLCVKKFTRTGTWVATISDPSFTITEKPISTALDADNNCYILTSNGISIFDSNNTYMRRIALDAYSLEGLKSIETCRDGGFLYVTTSNRIIKIAYTGVIAGTFGEEYGGTFKKTFHDAHRNLYISNGLSILKYIDKLDLIGLTNADTILMGWPMDHVYVQSDEYIQDWVLNRSFARFWDNLELFRRSLDGKFDHTTINNILYPIIRSFAVSEFSTFTFNKNDIFVGINELVTADVFNRCIGKLYNCEVILSNMISD